MNKQERNNLKDRIIKLSGAPDIEYAWNRMKEETDSELKDRYERLKHNNSQAVDNWVNSKVDEMASAKGFTSNTMLD